MLEIKQKLEHLKSKKVEIETRLSILNAEKSEILNKLAEKRIDVSNLDASIKKLETEIKGQLKEIKLPDVRVD
jgi:peptidoglycan hydrolase CwlO-like protein